jgi:hypothetical protein
MAQAVGCLLCKCPLNSNTSPIKKKKKKKLFGVDVVAHVCNLSTQEDCEFQASLGYMLRCVSKIKKQKTKNSCYDLLLPPVLLMRGH